MNCEKCGKPIPENINYCPSCSLAENPNYIKYMEEQKSKENISLKKETKKSNLNVNGPISTSTQQLDTNENVSNETNNLNNVSLAGVTSNQVNNNLNNQELQLEIIQSVPEANSIPPIPTITSNESPLNQIENLEINTNHLIPTPEPVQPSNEMPAEVLNSKNKIGVTILVLILTIILVIGSIPFISFGFLLSLVFVPLIIAVFCLLRIAYLFYKSEDPKKYVLMSLFLAIIPFALFFLTSGFFLGFGGSLFLPILPPIVIGALMSGIVGLRSSGRKKGVAFLALIINAVPLIFTAFLLVMGLPSYLGTLMSSGEYNKQANEEKNQSQKNSEYEIGKQLADMAYEVCYGKYNIVYAPKEFKNRGIFYCEKSKQMYYINDTNKKTGYMIEGQMYEIGYTYYNEDYYKIEDIFPGEIYLFRRTGMSNLPSELKIALVAENEEELVEKYAEKFYQLIKNMNAQYQSEIILTVYFNKTLSGIEKPYDKLFLSAMYYPYNVSFGNGFGKYILNFGDPEDLFNNIFGNPSSYPANARNALKNNRHIILEINNGKTITLDEFIHQFKNSFKNSL